MPDKFADESIDVSQKSDEEWNAVLEGCQFYSENLNLKVKTELVRRKRGRGTALAAFSTMPGESVPVKKIQRSAITIPTPTLLMSCNFYRSLSWPAESPNIAVSNLFLRCYIIFHWL